MYLKNFFNCNVIFSGIKTPEPSIRDMINKYYILHFKDEYERYTELYISSFIKDNTGVLNKDSTIIEFFIANPPLLESSNSFEPTIKEIVERYYNFHFDPKDAQNYIDLYIQKFSEQNSFLLKD